MVRSERGAHTAREIDQTANRTLRHAVTGALEVGGVALIVDAVDREIVAWYQARVPDFRQLTPDGLRLILSMRKLV